MVSGADQVIVEVASLFEVAVTFVGASGTVAGVTETLAPAPVPTRFVAVTVNVYVVPLARPGNVHEVDVTAQVRPEGDDVTT